MAFAVDTTGGVLALECSRFAATAVTFRCVLALVIIVGTAVLAFCMSRLRLVLLPLNL